MRNLHRTRRKRKGLAGRFANLLILTYMFRMHTFAAASTGGIFVSDENSTLAVVFLRQGGDFMGRISSPGKSATIVTLVFIAFIVIAHIGLALAAGITAFVNPKQRVDLAVYSVYNSNMTGYKFVPGFIGYARNLPDQSVHRNFCADTNSCASCHMAHTAPGEQFLFQTSAYNTCSACHFDETTNTYNILLGSPGGRFFDSDFIMAEERVGVSFHLATGAKKAGQAPGADYSLAGWWENEFSCSSCHAPHGSYSSRLLQVNPNGRTARFGPVPLQCDDDGYYRPEGFADKIPWIYYNPDTELFTDYGVVVRNKSGNLVRDDIFIHYERGYVELAEAAEGPYTIAFSQAMIVDIQIENRGTENEVITYRSGIVRFCTACHPGYLENREGINYTVHELFEHRINMNVTEAVYSPSDERFKLEIDRSNNEKRLVCLSCHFAHGTDAALMLDRNFEKIKTEENASSSTCILRFGGREACFVCH
jgi:hypothetical protein